MRFPFKRPKYDDIDNEYVIPVRFSEGVTHSMLAGWYPVGFGWAHLRPRDDGSFDLFTRQAEINEDLNLVRLDLVQKALMASLDLANKILLLDEDEEVTDELRDTAQLAFDFITGVGDS